MQIEQSSSGELLELTVTGSLDNDTSMHFQETINNYIHDGWHRILIHMDGVNYLSSAGIGALLSAGKRLAQLHGFFGICNPTAEVERTLAQTKLLETLLCDPEQARQEISVGNQTLRMNVRIDRAAGLDFEIYTFEGEDNSVTCRIYGSPQPLFESSFSEQDCRSVEFAPDSFGLGLGALGSSFVNSQSRFGEFLSVAGNVAQSGQGLPDYSITQGEFRPKVQTLYGLNCTGSFSHFIRFQTIDPTQRATLSTVAAQCLKHSYSQIAGIVILAESAGLVGARPKKSPVETVTVGGERFQIPAIREWMSYSPERVYARNLALIAGVVRSHEAQLQNPALDALLRPLDEHCTLQGHFHAAVFPYRPFKKRTLDYESTVRDLFEAGAMQDILHLLSDRRPQFGVGESEFLSGACWVAPVSEIPRED